MIKILRYHMDLNTTRYLIQKDQTKMFDFESYLKEELIILGYYRTTINLWV